MTRFLCVDRAISRAILVDLLANGFTAMWDGAYIIVNAELDDYASIVHKHMGLIISA